MTCFFCKGEMKPSTTIHTVQLKNCVVVQHEQANEQRRLAGSLQPVAGGGAERRRAPVFLQ